MLTYARCRVLTYAGICRCYPIPNALHCGGDSVRLLPGPDAHNDNSKILMRDLLNSGVMFEREAAVLRGRNNGVWFDMKPWQTHAFELSFL